jgi:hypothetical protein
MRARHAGYSENSGGGRGESIDARGSLYSEDDLVGLIACWSGGEGGCLCAHGDKHDAVGGFALDKACPLQCRRRAVVAKLIT